MIINAILIFRESDIPTLNVFTRIKHVIVMSTQVDHEKNFDAGLTIDCGLCQRGGPGV